MGKKRKDTDYVYLSTRVKAMERGLLDRARAERVLAAPTEEAAARVLRECGYPDLAGVTGRALEAALARRQGSCWRTWPETCLTGRYWTCSGHRWTITTPRCW